MAWGGRARFLEEQRETGSCSRRFGEEAETTRVRQTQEESKRRVQGTNPNTFLLKLVLTFSHPNELFQKLLVTKILP